MGLFTRNVPSCLSMSALAPITVPTILGVMFMVAKKAPAIISTAKQIQQSAGQYAQLVNNVRAQVAAQVNEEVEDM